MRNRDSGRGRWSRRDFLQTSAATLVTAAGIGCSDPSRSSEFSGNSLLTTQITAPTSSLAPGTHPLGLDPTRDGRLFIPSTYQHDTPSTLVLLLHGASGTGAGIATALEALAETAGTVVLAPDSRYNTWDVIFQDFGPDVTFIDAAIAWAVERVNVDPAHLTIAGFSDGATYALALGLSNGALFKRVIAFSPGFLFVRTVRGQPDVFITHGENDPVLPISTTSRTIVPVLENAGYDVDYHEFEGGHVIDPDLAADALAWASTP
jgi:predicted esterase